MRFTEITKEFDGADMTDVKVLQCYSLALTQYISSLQDDLIKANTIIKRQQETIARIEDDLLADEEIEFCEDRKVNECHNCRYSNCKWWRLIESTKEQLDIDVKFCYPISDFKEYIDEEMEQAKKDKEADFLAKISEEYPNLLMSVQNEIEYPMNDKGLKELQLWSDWVNEGFYNLI